MVFRCGVRGELSLLQKDPPGKLIEGGKYEEGDEAARLSRSFDPTPPSRWRAARKVLSSLNLDQNIVPVAPLRPAQLVALGGNHTTRTLSSLAICPFVLLMFRRNADHNASPLHSGHISASHGATVRELVRFKSFAISNAPPHGLYHCRTSIIWNN